MSDEVTVTVAIQDVEVGVTIPARDDGALPYAIKDVLDDVTASALKAWHDSGLSTVEPPDGDDAAD
jgi:hypothetical protein